MTENRDAFIKVQDLVFNYTEDSGKAHPAVNGLSVEIMRGEYVAVLGRNGSGKSTFAKLLNMILEADDGKIYIDGREITADDMTDDDVFELRRKVGMVFQNPDNQLVATIVEEDVAFGPENLGVPSAEIRERVNEALGMVGMLEFAEHEPHRLSGGQKQKIAIAGLIAMKPECMIFDESTSMLDPSGRREVVKTMEKLNRERGITIITITHHMDEAVRADRVIVMDDGKIIADDVPRKVFTKQALLEKAGLDVPQSIALMNKLRPTLEKAGISVREDCITPEECAAELARVLVE